MKRFPLALVLVALAVPAPVYAAAAPPPSETIAMQAADVTVAPSPPVAFEAAPPRRAQIAMQRPPTEARSPLLFSMYAMAIAVQAYDGYSTLSAVGSHRATEANPLVAGLVAHPTLFLAVKGAAAFATIAAADHLWRTHHRGQAIAIIAASNCVMAIVAAHNASVLRAFR